MFIDQPDQTCLRQGDILANIAFPQLATAKTAFLGSASLHAPGELRFAPHLKEVRRQQMYTCQVETRIGFGTIITQCCDLAPREGNRIEQPTIALARLVPVPAGILNDSDAIMELRSNSDPRQPGAGYLNLFYVERHEQLGNQELMIDFGQVFSIPANEFPAILVTKVLQMTNDARIRLKMRLAASFARFTDEEYESGHPWLNPPEAVP
jgi:hypothetical protein